MHYVLVTVHHRARSFPPPPLLPYHHMNLRYFEQYGLCAQCPSAQSPLSILASLGFPLLLAVVVAALVALRAMMARGMMKVR